MDDPSKEITKLIWSLGNYEAIAKTTMPAAERLVEDARVGAGQRVLDVATGSGNVALVAASKGATVSACDLTPAMVELATARATKEGADIEFREGDAEALPYPDGTFDVVLSTFGAMFAPRPEVAAAGMFRVLHTDGVLGMANWTPSSLIGRQTQILSSYAPGGPPDPDPLLWGTKSGVEERLGPHAKEIQTSSHAITEEYDSWDELLARYENDLGPAIALKQILEPERYQELRERIRELYESENRSGGDRLVAEAEYLQVIARKL